MKAALRDEYGPIDVVRLKEIEMPEPAGDEVLVRVEAASVNRADLDSLGPRPGFARAFMGLRAPRVRRLGIDVSGVVEAVGSGTTRFQAGDRVFADLFSFGSGAFGEYVCASEKAFASIPDGMTFEDAATLPHSAVLALQGLRLRSGRTIRAGDRVLIDGASGNVGPFAVQIAKSMGAEVTGVCRTEKVEFVRSLGADHVIDYRTTDYTKSGQRYDWIVDTDSHHSTFSVLRALRPNGVYVTLGGTSFPIFAAMLLAPLIGKASGHSMGLLLWWKPFHAPDVETLLGLVAAGKVKPAIDRRYPLSDVVDALRHVDEGRAKGKVIVTP
ncbi:MAG TPA: NAD(P)-dependent alcohol dehydrogenase [Candidatus Limnocylindrales bacterium]|jgi:NADPH:quinone reductase-like Zn-dependent oxidoreductase